MKWFFFLSGFSIYVFLFVIHLIADQTKVAYILLILINFHCSILNTGSWVYCVLIMNDLRWGGNSKLSHWCLLCFDFPIPTVKYPDQSTNWKLFNFIFFSLPVLNAMTADKLTSIIDHDFLCLKIAHLCIKCIKLFCLRLAIMDFVWIFSCVMFGSRQWRPTAISYFNILKQFILF